MDRVDDWRTALDQIDKPNPSINSNKSTIIDLTNSDSSSSSSGEEEDEIDSDGSPNSVKIIERPQISITKVIIPQRLPPNQPIFKQQQLPLMIKKQQQQQNHSTNFNSPQLTNNPFRSNNNNINNKSNETQFVTKAEGFMSVKERAMADMKSNAIKMGIPIGIPVNPPYKRPPIVKSTTPRPREHSYSQFPWM